MNAKKPKSIVKGIPGIILTAATALLLCLAPGYGEFDDDSSENGEIESSIDVVHVPRFIKIEADGSFSDPGISMADFEGRWRLVDDDLARRVAAVQPFMTISLCRRAAACTPHMVLECHDSVLHFDTLASADSIAVLPPDSRNESAWIIACKGKDVLYAGPAVLIGIIRPEPASPSKSKPAGPPEPAKRKYRAPNGIKMVVAA